MTTGIYLNNYHIEARNMGIRAYQFSFGIAALNSVALSGTFGEEMIPRIACTASACILSYFVLDDRLHLRRYPFGATQEMQKWFRENATGTLNRLTLAGAASGAGAGLIDNWWKLAAVSAMAWGITEVSGRCARRVYGRIDFYAQRFSAYGIDLARR